VTTLIKDTPMTKALYELPLSRFLPLKPGSPSKARRTVCIGFRARADAPFHVGAREGDRTLFAADASWAGRAAARGWKEAPWLRYT